MESAGIIGTNGIDHGAGVLRYPVQLDDRSRRWNGVGDPDLASNLLPDDRPADREGQRGAHQAAPRDLRERLRNTR
jgi:hypothetical protein